MKQPFIQRVKLALKVATGAVSKRYFDGGSTDRTKNDWGTSVTSPDAEMRNDLGALRSRCRELERNNEYFSRYLTLVENNVIGSEGINLHMHILDPSGKLDSGACNIIEKAWLKWCKKSNCTITGLYTFDEFSRLALRSVARDGSVLIQKIVGKEAGNSFGFALKVMECDHLDRFYSGYAPNGNEVRLGVEYDKDSVNQKRKPVAYWITPRHPGDYIGYSGNYTRRRIPANEVIHLYRATRFEQSEGVPWGCAAMSNLNMLGAYQEATLVSARAGACQQGYITTSDGEEYKGDMVDAKGQQLSQMEPGVVKVLPKGASFIPHSPSSPPTSYGEFVKAALRGTSASLNVSYPTLSCDLSDSSYSSARVGMLDERDMYRQIQRWFIDSCCEEIFQPWLPLAFLSGEISLPFAKLEKFNAPTWKARTWDWVDPLKDQNANVMAINNLLDSPQHILAGQGRNAEKVLDEIAEWKAMLDARGLEPAPVAGANIVQPTEPAADDSVDSTAKKKPVKK